MGALGRLWEPLGEWRTRVLFRLFAFCVFVYTLVKYAGTARLDLLPILSEREFHGLSLCALLLLLAGPRLLVIAGTLAWALICFGLLLSGGTDLMSFPAAEWAIFLLVPLFSCGVVLLALARAALARSQDARAYRAEVDWGITAVFRVMAAVVLGFAALHKLNTDFFDPSVSCIELKERLNEWWGLPSAAYDWFGPYQVVTAEGLSPVLLAVAPWLGIPVTVMMVSMFASIGAPAFAGLVITMALAFVPHSARGVLERGMRRRWPWIALSLAAVVAARLFYRGDYPWLPLALAQALAVIALWVAAFLAVDRLRRLRDPAAAAAQPPAQDGPRATPAQRGLIACMALACVFNGLTPYLGLKFQYSFAMLSNLRVDDARWNSLVFPRTLRLVPHDDYVHVTRARYKKLPSGPVLDSGGLLDPGMYSPSAVRHVLGRSFEIGVQVALDFDYHGKQYRFIDSADPMQLYTFASTLPSTPLIQKMLDGDKPQSCFH